jgi:hypothetical protein
MAAQLIATKRAVARGDKSWSARGLPEDQHGCGRWRDLLDHPADALHFRVEREDPRHRALRPRELQAPVLRLQLVQAVRALDGQAEHVGVERLAAEVVGPERDRAKRIGAVVLAGQHDDLRVRGELADFLQQRKPLGGVVGMRRKAEVHRHDRGLEPAQLCDRGRAIVGNDGLVGVECPAHLLLKRMVVLDDQQRQAGLRHQAASFMDAAGPTEPLPCGSSNRTRVPDPSLLSTRMRPPSPATYC